MQQIRAAVIGLGHWGPTVAKNLRASRDFDLVAVCDRDAARLEGARSGDEQAFTSSEAMIAEVRPLFVAVCTPVSTHHAIVKHAVLEGVHVLCEKPLAATAREAAELVALAERRKTRLFVNHMCANAAPLEAVREQVHSGAIGELFHIDAERINRGRVQPDVDVIGDLAPHDLAIIDRIAGRKVESVAARGGGHDAHVELRLAGGLTASLRLSWVSPIRVRRMVFRGTAASVVYDETAGDALAAELAEIARALRGEPGARVATGEHGLAAVRVLEASRASLARNGATIVL